MEFIEANLKNCYNLSTIGDKSIVDWSGNNSTEIITVLVYTQLPGTFYKEFNNVEYQWSGPILLFVVNIIPDTKCEVAFLLAREKM